MQDRSKWISVAVFAALLASLCGVNLFTPDRTFSETENRVLADAPKLSAKTLLSGEFTGAIDEYVSDQFFLRDRWISLLNGTKRALGDRELNGVYLGRDGYYLQNTDLSDRATFDANLAAVRGCFDRLSARFDANRLSFLLVPTAASVLRDRLPACAPVPPEDDCIAAANDALEGYCTIDPRESLRAHADEPIYFKTDHHWTAQGAFLGYTAFCAAQGLPAPDISDYTVETVATDFRGSLYSKAPFDAAAYDTLSLYLPRKAQNVTYISPDRRFAGCYDREKLEHKDKYLVFLGENASDAVLQTDAGTGRRLLIFKDSYANCFVPFLTTHYDAVHLIDLRYFRGSLDDYLEKNKITDLLLLYNIANFAQDGSLSLLDTLSQP